MKLKKQLGIKYKVAMGSPKVPKIPKVTFHPKAASPVFPQVSAFRKTSPQPKGANTSPTTPKIALPQQPLQQPPPTPEITLKKKNLQARLRNMMQNAPQRAVNLGMSFFQNASPLVSKARPDMKGAKVVKQTINNFGPNADRQALQYMLSHMGQTPTTSPTFTDTTPTTTTDTDTDTDTDFENFFADEKIDMLENVPIDEAKDKLNIAPQENEIIDTRDIALGYSDWRVENSCRTTCVWILMLANLVLLISLFLDVSIYSDVMKLLQPFGHILNTKTKADDNNVDENEKYRTYVIIASTLTLFIASFRIFLLLKVMEMEDSDYQTRPSDFPCSCFQFLTFINIIYWFYVICVITPNLLIIVNNFETIFLAKEANYANESTPQIMVQMDKLQQTFKCCGASGIKSWYKQDLYKVMREDGSVATLKYWEMFEKCHPFESKGDLKKLMNAHVPSDTDDKKVISSVPFSCCSAESDSLCVFYNHNNADNYWKVTNLEDALYKSSCKEKVMPSLVNLGMKIETLYFYRLLLEICIFLLMGVVKSSFVSYYENNHRPSVATIPICWAFLTIICLAIFYTFKLKFFNWKYSFKVFFGLSSNKLDDIVNILVNSSSNSSILNVEVLTNT